MGHREEAKVPSTRNNNCYKYQHICLLMSAPLVRVPVDFAVLFFVIVMRLLVNNLEPFGNWPVQNKMKLGILILIVDLKGYTLIY